MRALMIRSPDDTVRQVHCSLRIQRGSTRPMIVVPKYQPSRESLDRRFIRKTSPTPMRWQPLSNWQRSATMPTTASREQLDYH